MLPNVYFDLINFERLRKYDDLPRTFILQLLKDKSNAGYKREAGWLTNTVSHSMEFFCKSLL